MINCNYRYQTSRKKKFVTLRNCQQDTFCEKGVLKNFIKFTEKKYLVKSK